MKKFFPLLLFCIFISCGDDKPNPCIVAEDFILEELNYPAEANVSVFNCNSEENSTFNYTVWHKVEASNAFGVKKEIVFKLKLKYNGTGITTDASNWDLISVRSEEL